MRNDVRNKTTYNSGAFDQAKARGACGEYKGGSPRRIMGSEAYPDMADWKCKCDLAPVAEPVGARR